MTGAFLIASYLACSALVIFLGLRRRFAFLLCWPYIAYGFGLLAPVLFPDFPEFAYFRQYYDDDVLRRASLACTAALVVFTGLDYLIFGRKTFRSLIDRPDLVRALTATVSSPVFRILVYINAAVFVALYIAAWRAGDIFGAYDFRVIEQLRYWGPLGAISDGICALALAYGAGRILSRWQMRRDLVVEAILLAALIARALAGTRMPFVKTAATLMLLSLLALKIRLKHVIVIVCVTVVVYAGGLLIGYSRLGRSFDPETSSRLDPLMGESFNVNLSLMIATHNLDQKIYHPGLPVAVALYILPSWSVDKPALIARWFDRDGYAQDAGYDYISPVGAVHFLADALIALGPYFLVVVALTALLAYLPFVGRFRGHHVLLFLLVLSTCHNLWRDSYLIAIKQALELYGIEYLVLWTLTRENRLRALAPGRENA